MNRFSFYKGPLSSQSGCIPTCTMTVSDAYDYICSDKARNRTLELRNLPKESRGKYKIENFEYATFGGIFSTRSSDGLIAASNLLCLDFDHLENVKKTKEDLLRTADFGIMLAFVSPSGDGLKLVVKMNPSWGTLSDYVSGFSKYFIERFGIQLDVSGKDVCRACLLPYDPEAYLNRDTDIAVFDPRPFLNLRKTTKNTTLGFPCRTNIEELEHVECVVSRIESAGVDIAPSYDEFLKLGFALASSFNEAGRILYHRLCRLHPEYDYKSVDLQYTRCLKSNSEGINLASFFYLCKRANIDISVNRGENNKTAYIAHLAYDTKSSECSHDDVLPRFGENVYNLLPEFLQQSTAYAGEGQRADVVLLSSLAFCSAALPNITGRYDDVAYSPHLYVFIEGPASSGKGMVNVARYLGEPLQELLDLEYKQKLESYYSQLDEWEKSGGVSGDKPIEPHRSLFVVPGNCTASALVRQLSYNKGSGLIVESEVDTVWNAFRSEHGNYSDILRKSWSHEHVSLLRKTDNEYIDILRPRITCLMAGTPRQICRIIGNPENGLFSRIAFYHTCLDEDWCDPFNKKHKSMSDYYCGLGHEFLERYRNWGHENKLFELSNNQQVQFNDCFSKIKKNMLGVANDDIIPTVHRLGVLFFRIAMILSSLRDIEKGKGGADILVCDDDSFYAAKEITQVLLQHSQYEMSLLNDSNPSLIDGRLSAFYERLPSQFSRAEYQQIAISLGLNPRTVDRYIRRFVTEGKLEHQLNLYRKKHD